MIRNLRIKIATIIFTLLTLVVVGIMIAINVISQSDNTAIIMSKLEDIAVSNGKVTSVRGGESYYEHFSVMIDGAYNLIGIAYSSDVVMQEKVIIDYADQALAFHENSGTIGSYRFIIMRKSYGKIISFMDISAYQQADRSLLLITSIIGGIGIIVFFFMSVLLAIWLVKPVQESFDKQRLFISNASHELKTPLAVISANADVLESEIGENKWLSYIRSESARMSELVNEFLILARLDDKMGHQISIAELNLSDLVLRTVLPFESTVYEMGKRLETDVEPDIMYCGDASILKHIVTILTDNAVKYSDEHGEICVKLSKKGSRRILEVYNTGVGIQRDKLRKIFERFYREDEVRNSKSGGYGLGLSIAQIGTEALGGRIYAESEPGKWARFIVIL